MNKIYGFDIEAVPLQLYIPEAQLLCASVSQDFTVSYVKDHFQRELINEEVNLLSLAVIGNVLGDKTNTITGHNLPFDVVGWERFFQINNPGKRAIKAKLFDTMIAHYLVGYKNSEFNNLDFVSNKYLGFSKLNIEIKGKDYPKAPLDLLLMYNAVDSMLAYKLYEPLMNEIIDNNFETLYKYLMKILRILISMSIRGVRLDLDYIRKHKEEVSEKIGDIHDTLINNWGNINYNSPKQLQQLLYEERKLPILEYTKHATNPQPSIGIDAIIELKNNPNVYDSDKTLLQSLLNYRKLKKLHSTYLEVLEKKHLGYDGRIHAQYFLGKGSDQERNYGTVSGRTSSSNPNLQNQPNLVTIDELEVDIRKAFIPSEWFKFYKADYSQIEMRVMAYLSKDKTMLEVFKNNLDIHILLMQNVYEEDYEWLYNEIKVKENQKWIKLRRVMKNFNFATGYGASPWKLQGMLSKEQEIDLHIDEVRRITNVTNRTYNGLTKWRYNVHDIIDNLGYVRSETGRIRWFFEEGEGINYDGKTIASFHREGLNHLIQSFANDIAMFGIMFLYNYMRKNKIGYPLLPVHDSIDGEYLIDKQLEENEVKKCMIDKPKRLLEKEFMLDTTNLYLDVEVKTGLDHWS